ncbi:MAG TPA: alpha/beta hydrolase, partial [Rhodospirillaceae bacterium]|nr:alpha/beta hydrolase [Rhodospirillaceae bacterium]
PDAALRAFLLQNLATEDGKLRWRLNLPVLAASLPTILDFPQSEGRFDGPTLFLAGEHSDYIRPRDEATIRRYFPQARLCEIAQSGHWPHADQTDRFLALVRNALQVETA